MEIEEQRIRRVVSEEVAVVPNDPAWPEAFRQEAEHLWSCLPTDLIRRIEHSGSTAVPGLAAKPIVDMLVEVTNLQGVRARIAYARGKAEFIDRVTGEAARHFHPRTRT